MNHSYEKLEGSRLWLSLDAAIGELVDNQDLRETTRREYIVGYLATKLVRARVVLASGAKAPMRVARAKPVRGRRSKVAKSRR